MDSEQRQIGVTGYRPGGPKQYANHLNKIIQGFSAYKDKMQNVDKQTYSGADLKQLYEQANELGLENDATKIMKMGMASDQKPFPFS